jgi:Glycosyltransferase family 87
MANVRWRADVGASFNDGPAQALVVGALWVGGVALIAVLIVQRYRGAIGSAPLVHGNNVDFNSFFQAARYIASGKSPYTGSDHYTYFAPLALILSLVTHSGPITVLKCWTVIDLFSLITAVVLVVWALRDRLDAPWQLPVLFSVCAGIALHIWPMAYELFLGNDDIIVLLLVVAAALAWRSERPAWFGIIVGSMCLIKVWPALLMIVVFQAGVSTRRRTISSAAFVGTVVLGLLSNLIPAGSREFTGFIGALKSTESLHLVSDSVSGIPKLLFSKSGLATPVLMSGGLRYLLTAGLGVWVLALLILTLRNRREAILTVFNVALFAVLVVPVSHMCYTILALPVVWYWLGNTRVLLSLTPRRGWTLGALIVLALTVGLWVLVQSKAWPGDGSPADLSSIRFTVVFVANLALYSVSVLAGRLFLVDASTSKVVPRPLSLDATADLDEGVTGSVA